MTGDFDDDERRRLSELLNPRKPKEYPPSRDIGWYLTRVIIPLVVAIIAALGAIIASGNGQVVVNIVNSVMGRSDDNFVRTQVAIELTETKIAPTPVSSINATATAVAIDPSPTFIPSLTVTATAKSTLVPRVNGLYDDFNNPDFNGRLNPILWGGGVGQWAEDAKQAAGIMKLVTSPSTDESGYIVGFSGISKDVFRSVQAKMMLNSNTNRNGNVTFSILSKDIPGGWIETGLYRIGDGTWYTMAKVGEKSFKTRTINPNTWYTIRVDFDVNSSTFTTYIDDQLFATYKNPKSISLMSPTIQIWRGNQNINVDASVDDVYLYE